MPRFGAVPLTGSVVQVDSASAVVHAGFSAVDGMYIMLVFFGMGVPT